MYLPNKGSDEITFPSLPLINVFLPTSKTSFFNSVYSSSTKITGKASPSSSSGSSSSSKYVYANGGKYTSNIYHKTPKAHNMEGAIKMTVSQAKAKGYRACKRCW